MEMTTTGDAATESKSAWPEHLSVKTDEEGRAKAFIEEQFPVSKVSKESYKERVAKSGQTLTGLGKWWGRKPLVMVRATLFGLLLPATENPKKDREVFLKVMTMDDEGMLTRKKGNIKYSVAFDLLTEKEQRRFFDTGAIEAGKYHHHAIRAEACGTKKETKEEVQRLAFSRLSYEEKMQEAFRPENVEGPNEEAWKEINAYLGTTAASLSELVDELGQRRFGHTPRVGDAFCGGGSVPFEAARLGFDAYVYDMYPVAALLTWGALNITGGGEEVKEEVEAALEKVFEAATEQIREWGIEEKTEGPPPGSEVYDPDGGEPVGKQMGYREAGAYLYCTEVDCPECEVTVPLAPSWVVADSTQRVVAHLIEDGKEKRFDIEIETSASKKEVKKAKERGTVDGGDLCCPSCGKRTPISEIRGDGEAGEGEYGLRQWEEDEITPREDDVFGERLYCIRWNVRYEDESGKERMVRHYRAVTEEDLERERKAQALLEERFDEWQREGYIPSRRIESGYNTDQLMRERGWAYWHQLFTPRQLLTMGCLLKMGNNYRGSKAAKSAILLSLGRSLNYHSRLTHWHLSSAKAERVFYNQALNTFYNFSARSFLSDRYTSPLSDFLDVAKSNHKVTVSQAENIKLDRDFWLTDPPYADAVNYHELSEFFLAWYEKPIQNLFPEWYTDSKRELAIKGDGADFKQAMTESYANLADHMPDDGAQVVMFTHQNSSVWADLSMILWKAGLRVTAAWTIQTESTSALKKGNYVTGTVLLVLRKRTEEKSAFSDEIGFEVEDEVVEQIESMHALDEGEEARSFEDTDYQLAAYAAALRVLTGYSNIDGESIESRTFAQNGEASFAEEVIESAIETASNHLVPEGLSEFNWRQLSPEERFWIKGLEIESHGELRKGVYQELAKGYNADGYKGMLESGGANATRVKTASGFESTALDTSGEKGGFAGSLVRRLLFGIRQGRQSGDVQVGRRWLRDEVDAYWNQRDHLAHLADYIGSVGQGIERWEEDAQTARLLAEALRNDHA